MESIEFVVEMPEVETVVIDGFVHVKGFVHDEIKCHQCRASAIYYEEWDAMFCAYCNCWLDGRCGDNGCRYCIKRPAKPLPSENERRRLRQTE